MITLTTGLPKLAFIIEKAREFDAETAPVDEESGSNQADDAGVAILEDTSDNPVQQELTDALDSLADDERDELLALVWIGRGDFGRSEWQEALRMARQRHNGRETSYLLGTPLLPDYLEQGLEELGIALDENAR
jgi:hypothetical protein